MLLATLAWAIGCGSSTGGPTDSPEDRGCSDGPSVAGELLVSLDGASSFEVESFLLTDDDEVVAVWEAYGCDDVTRVGYARRTPTGFEHPRYLSSPGGQMASNVTFARAGDGTLYAAWASWTPGPDRAQPHVGVTDIRIQLARRPAGATGFDAPVEISEPIAAQLYDKPWLSVTPDGAILVSYSDLVRGGIWVASSNDGGASFRRTRVDTLGEPRGVVSRWSPGRRLRDVLREWRISHRLPRARAVTRAQA